MSPFLDASRTLAIALMLSVGAGVGCAGNPAAPGSVPLGQSFDLRAGRSATLSSGLRVTFDRVQSDSRCPMDALCVWAGDAIVVLTLAEGREGDVERELHTDPRRSEATFRAYSVRLVALAPYPRSDRRIHQTDYVATLTVTTK